jgi:DNA-binding CsgD family transcriptional regulator/PAS domain-containing protein
MSELGEAADRYPRWVAMWREPVTASRLAMGVVELSTTRFIALSQRAAELLGAAPERGADFTYLSVAERAREAAEGFRLARDGMLDGARTRRRFRRPDGSMVELESSGWVIRSPGGPDLGLWVPGQVCSATGHTQVVEDIVASPPFRLGSEGDGTRVILDDRWRMAQITTNAKALLGRLPAELLGSSIIELTHPDDVANLLLGFAQATTKASALVRVRLRRHDESWRRIRVLPTVLAGDGRSTFTVLMASDHESDAPEAFRGASEIAGDLRRIADNIETAGMLAPLAHTADALSVSATTALSPRQWEVVSRLVRGQRVATIAAEMYLSQSTVRNHLSVVYAKFDVHSQTELLARLLSRAKTLNQ